MIRYGLLGLSALALAACGGGGPNTELSEAYSGDSGFYSGGNEYAGQPAPQSVVVQEAKTSLQNGRERVANTSSSDPSPGADPAGVYLAYRYGYGLVMPAKSVKATTNKHIQICREAGPKLCQVTGSNTQNFSEENISANLSLRAEPDWLVGFVSGMKADVAEVDGRIANENTSVEDLTRAILDTDARLKAKRVLRTRLEKLLETRNAELPDLLALERELARVQAEIESATANLKALRARVSMSVVNINYTSERVAVSRSSVSPIGAAVKDFVGIVSSGLANVIRFFGAILPWLIFVIIPGLFALRWFWRRRNFKKKT
jgi:hypothetical protein